MLRATLIALVGLALCVPAAHADVFAGERPAGPRAQQLTAMAVEFWAARGVHACEPGITLLQAPSLEAGDGDAMGRGGNCKAWISDDEANDIDGPDRYLAGLRVGCAVVFHEIGHALGLGHSESGVMSTALSFPWECIRWAKQQMRPEDERLNYRDIQRAARRTQRVAIARARRSAAA